ncbi:hypothetical protein V2J09_019707 [Rumex salicifolius]
MADSPFKKDDKVEVSLDDEGFRGAWFSGTVVKSPTKRSKKVVIEYDTLVSEKDETMPLRDSVDLVKVRPVPPRESVRTFKVSEEVDAYFNDGWWEGIIISVIGQDSRYSVYFRCSGEQIEFPESDLRLHREWVHGDWVPAFPEPNSIPLETSVTKDEKEMQNLFSKGIQVEVSSDEDGFKGAWFDASVVSVLGKGKYLIEYKELRTDDDTEFLKEEVDCLHIRPIPPKTEVIDRFSLYEEVDALYNDGWWVGFISKVLVNSMYLVYFKESNEEMKFGHDQLRPHQDWMDGKWITTKKSESTTFLAGLEVFKLKIQEVFNHNINHIAHDKETVLLSNRLTNILNLIINFLGNICAFSDESFGREGLRDAGRGLKRDLLSIHERHIDLSDSDPDEELPGLDTCQFLDLGWLGIGSDFGPVRHQPAYLLELVLRLLLLLEPHEAGLFHVPTLVGVVHW